MRDPFAIAEALRDIAGEDAAIVSAEVGVNKLTSTPAAEVWMDSGTLARQRAATQGEIREEHEFIVGFFVRATANSRDDERQIATLVRTFVSTLHDPAFDYTLGGLVEQVEATGYELQLIDRDGYAFRVALVTVNAGEL